MNHVADPDRFLRRAVGRAKTLEPHFTVDLLGHTFLTGHDGKFFWKVELDHEIVKHLVDVVPLEEAER